MGARVKQSHAFASQTVATGTPVTLPVRNGRGGCAIITLVASGEVATSSTQMALTGKNPATGADIAFVASLGTPITAAGTTHYAIGFTSASPLTDLLTGNRLTGDFDIVLTCTGTNASMDFAVGVEWV